MTGLLALAAALSLGAAAHQLPGLLLRLPVYAALMATVILWWIGFRGGAGILRLLMRSRVDAPG